jgi:hypothetical protein
MFGHWRKPITAGAKNQETPLEPWVLHPVMTYLIPHANHQFAFDQSGLSRTGLTAFSREDIFGETVK